MKAMKPIVRIANQASYDPGEIRATVRRMLDADGIAVKGKSVFVKPSFVYPARPPLCRAVDTQPEFVGGVVHALRDLGARRVWVGEDSLLGPSAVAFEAMGVLPYMRGAAEPAFLKEAARVEVGVKDAFIEDRFRLPKSLMDADVFITLPKIKVNMHATVTLSVKNHVGLLLAADRLTNHHYNMHKKIADLYRARLPDYVLADAIIAGEGQGPMHATWVPTKCIIGGANGVAVDAVSCRMMGFEPEEIEHLMLLHQRGVGPVALADFDLEGAELLAARRRRFIRPRTDFGDYHHSIKFFVGTERACAEGCVGMMRGSLDRWAMINRWKPLKGYNFIVGRPLAEEPRGLKKGRTFVIGDCAAPYQHLGAFIPGCPIPAMAMTYALLLKGIHQGVCTRTSDIVVGQLKHSLGIRL
jgi:uncharacterized protein (DUF362 family)